MKDLYANKIGAEALLKTAKERGLSPDVVRIMRDGFHTFYGLTWIWSDPGNGMVDEARKSNGAFFWEQNTAFRGESRIMKPGTLRMIFIGMNAAETACGIARKVQEGFLAAVEFVVWLGKGAGNLIREDVTNARAAIAHRMEEARSAAKKFRENATELAVAKWKRARRAVKNAWITFRIYLVIVGCLTQRAAETLADDVVEAARFLMGVARLAATMIAWSVPLMVERAGETAASVAKKTLAKADIFIREAARNASRFANLVKGKVPAVVASIAQTARTTAENVRGTVKVAWKHTKESGKRLAKAVGKNVATLIEMNNIFNL